ncbi:extracellular solute-binding protein [Actinomadura sp. HBU206391]|nr:extracellular solute-binding protein [Actinomadura sp. HBU206391]
MSDRHVREYADRNALLDLQPYVGKQIQTADLAEHLMGLGTVGAKLYGLPLGQTTTVLQWDPAVWKKADAEEPKLGWTWDDYLAAAVKISKSTGGKVAFSDPGREESWFKVWLSQQGKGLYAADGALGYTEQDVATWWGMTQRFQKAGAFTPPEANPAANPKGSPWVRRISAAEFTPASTIAPGAFKARGGEFKLAPWPQVGSELGQYSEPPMLLSVSARSKHRDAALKLTDFVMNDPEAGKILGMARGVPANTKTRAAIAPSLPPESKLVYDFEQSVADKVKPGPPAPPKGASACTLAFAKVYEDVVFGKASPADAAKRYMSEARQALAG